ncbi:uncharacterized protein RCC_08688 [Ramularia collo-cygni]|uniref:Uncharacterized protein n=1 Tax=Ramularia collo-cygni TaxID=112498 RepID=A0A2D3V7U5_9PEZI|nr:uncharacterized protein RCC_08688 [Ramularia collo-cygni]CZT22980.1 uncharacterized protein RCC_08688 [Ramularia collo-cygni]
MELFENSPNTMDDALARQKSPSARSPIASSPAPIPPDRLAHRILSKNSPARLAQSLLGSKIQKTPPPETSHLEILPSRIQVRPSEKIHPPPYRETKSGPPAPSLQRLDLP